MGKVFPKAPVRIEKAMVKAASARGGAKAPAGIVKALVIGGGSNRITISKVFDAERKELTESNCVEKLSPVNIP